MAARAFRNKVAPVSAKSVITPSRSVVPTVTPAPSATQPKSGRCHVPAANAFEALLTVTVRPLS